MHELEKILLLMLTSHVVEMVSKNFLIFNILKCALLYIRDGCMVFRVRFATVSVCCQLDMPDDHLCENFQRLIDTASALKSKALSKYVMASRFSLGSSCYLE